MREDDKKLFDIFRNTTTQITVFISSTTILFPLSTTLLITLARIRAVSYYKKKKEKEREKERKGKRKL